MIGIQIMSIFYCIKKSAILKEFIIQLNDGRDFINFIQHLIL